MSRDPVNSQEIILTSIGLKSLMVEKDGQQIFQNDQFIRYAPQEYLKSERKETDEIYRMSEVVLLHKLTGLRFLYLTTENYFGDECTYKLLSIFIVNNSNRTIPVLDVKFEKKLFITPDGLLPFMEAKKEAGKN